MSTSVRTNERQVRFFRLPAPIRGLLLLLLIWIPVGAALAVFVFAAFYPDRRLAQQMQRHGITTLATVTKLDLGDHGRFFYTYQADGRTYATADNGVGLEGPVARVGESIHVLFDSTEPSRSCYCTVADMNRASSIMSTAICGFALASIVSLVLSFAIWDGGKIPRIRRWFRPDEEWEIARRRNAERAMFRRVSRPG